MKGAFSQYLIGVLLIAFSFYQVFLEEYVEFAMYLSAGLGFVMAGLIKDNVFEKQHRLLTILSWGCIFIAGFLLLFLFRTDQ